MEDLACIYYVLKINQSVYSYKRRGVHMVCVPLGEQTAFHSP